MQKSILLDRNVFEENYVPEKIISRKEQTIKLQQCLQPVKAGDFTVNVYVHGPSGVGKTLVCTDVLKRHFQKQFIYVDCFEDNRKRDIMEQVIAQAGIFRRGKPSTRDMIKRFGQSKKKFIICLDRCELIKEPDIIEAFVINQCGLVLISNQPLSISKLALRGNSKLYLDEIEFKPYNRDEVFQILKERVPCGISSEAVTDDLLLISAGMCNGDARRALQIVKLAAREAEMLGQKRITIENVESALQKTKGQQISSFIDKLSEKEKKFFHILKENRRMGSGELFRVYKELSNEEITDRSYRNQMTHLKELGLVKESGVTKGKVYEIA